MKHKVEKFVAIFLILAGFALIHIVVIGEGYTKYRRNDALRQIENVVYNTPSSTTVQSTDAAFPSATPQTVWDNSYVEAYGQTLLGMIQIAKIDLTLPMVEGVEDSNLVYGVGHMPMTAMPGEWGNVVLAGHRNYVFGQSFNRLNELETGDDIILTYNGSILTYRVYDIFVVLPEDVWVRNSNSSEKIITLITCTPILTATHRLIVRARLL